MNSHMHEEPNEKKQFTKIEECTQTNEKLRRCTEQRNGSRTKIKLPVCCSVFVLYSVYYISEYRSMFDLCVKKRDRQTETKERNQRCIISYIRCVHSFSSSKRNNNNNNNNNSSSSSEWLATEDPLQRMKKTCTHFL